MIPVHQTYRNILHRNILQKRCESNVSIIILFMIVQNHFSFIFLNVLDSIFDKFIDCVYM